MKTPKTYSFLTFYACYLLKSNQTPRSYRNYIGSTRDPKHRLRQHNGEIAQGARKTARGRPWEMQLHVHGFPSKPAALTFEYAWQNPHNSRYLRDDTGSPMFQKRGSRLEHNILVLQKLIQSHPFSTWPLHVKLLTEQAIQCWEVLTSASPLVSSSVLRDTCREIVAPGQRQDRQQYDSLFPPGFTCSIELKDESSGKQVSTSKTSIIDVNLTAPYLAKSTALVGSGHPLRCSVCSSRIYDFDTNHLGTTLCTQTGCTSVAHLMCLANSWLDVERRLASSAIPFPSLSSISPPSHLPASSGLSSKPSIHPLSSSEISVPPRSPFTPSANNISSIIPASSSINPFKLGGGMLPRGGTCTSCENYVLWGDVVKGCFVRYTGSIKSMKLKAKEGSGKENPSFSYLNSDSGPDSDKRLTKEQELLALENTISRRGRKAKYTSSSPDRTLSARSPGRPRKVGTKTTSGTTKKRGRPRKEQKTVAACEPEVSGGPGRVRSRRQSGKLPPASEPTSSVSVSPRRGPGRPRKPLPVLETELPTKLRGPGRPKKQSPTHETANLRGRGRPRKVTNASNSLPSISTSVPRKCGRPRKASPVLLDYPITGSVVGSQPQMRLAPRRRGRPPKIVNVDGGVTSDVGLTAKDSTKRRPGRPKGVNSKVGAECAFSTASASSNSKMNPGGDGVRPLSIVDAVKTRRKRGRPRRSGDNASDGTSEGIDFSTVGLESSTRSDGT